MKKRSWFIAAILLVLLFSVACFAEGEYSVWINRNEQSIELDSRDGITVLFTEASMKDEIINFHFKIDGGISHMPIEMYNITVGGEKYTPAASYQVSGYLMSDNGSITMNIVNPEMKPVGFSLRVDASLVKGKKKYEIGPFTFRFDGDFTAAGEEKPAVSLARMLEGNQFLLADREQVKIYLANIYDAPSRFDESMNCYTLSFSVINDRDDMIGISLENPESGNASLMQDAFSNVVPAHSEERVMLTLLDYDRSLPLIAEAESLSFDMLIAGRNSDGTFSDLFYISSVSVDPSPAEPREAIRLDLPAPAEMGSADSLETPVPLLDENGIKVEITGLSYDMMMYPGLLLKLQVSNQTQETLALHCFDCMIDESNAFGSVYADILPESEDQYDLMLYVRQEMPLENAGQASFRLAAYSGTLRQNIVCAGPFELIFAQE